MKLQTLEDYDQHIASYTYTDTEYEDSDIRLRIDAEPGAPHEQLVRRNLMYAIKTLAIDQLKHENLYGAQFSESYHGQLLYGGVFDSKFDPTSLELTSNSSAGPSERLRQEKRALSTPSFDSTQSSTTLVDISGSNDLDYRLEFEFRGEDHISNIDIFSAILEMLMTLARRESDHAILHVSQLTPVDSLWIFAMHDSRSRFVFQVFQLVAILEGLARYAVFKTRYQEMSFKFFIDEEVVARGCITMPIASRVWCRPWF